MPEKYIFFIERYFLGLVFIAVLNQPWKIAKLYYSAKVGQLLKWHLGVFTPTVYMLSIGGSEQA